MCIHDNKVLAMKRFNNVIILFIIILISSCENDSNNENGINFLKNSKWILLGFQPHDTHILEFKPENLKEMGIEFNDSHWIHAISSCNWFDGYYSVAGHDIIQIDSLYSTMMNCENDTIRIWEDRYYNELKNAKNYQMAGDSLIITTKLSTDIIFLAEYLTN